MPEAKHRSISASRTLAVIAMMVAAMHSLALFEMESVGPLKPEDSEALIPRMAQIIWQTSPFASAT